MRVICKQLLYSIASGTVNKKWVCVQYSYCSAIYIFKCGTQQLVLLVKACRILPTEAGRKKNRFLCGEYYLATTFILESLPL